MTWPLPALLALRQFGPWALVALRAVGLAATAPAWSTPALGWRMRLALAAVVTAALVPAVGPSVAAPAGAVALGRALAVELLVGAGLGLSAALIVAAARQAGEVVGGQAGLSAASLFDPEAGADLTPLGHLYGLIALGGFLALDGPLNLVAALVRSYRVLPAGGAGLDLTPESAALAFGRVGEALGLSLQAAAPAAVALAAAGLALGLLGRAAPGFQLGSLALPVRSAVGLVLVLIGLSTLAATFAAAWGGWFAEWGG